MSLIDFDKHLYFKINQEITHPILDQIAPVITDLHKAKWFLLYILPALLLYWLLRDRLRAIKIFLILILAIGTSDTLTAKGLKPLFQRPRPNLVESNAILRTNKHAGTSFPSVHAANVATGAMLLSACYLQWSPLYFLILIVVMWSRVYVGVHYPLDVVGGAFVGFILGYIFYLIFRMLIKPKVVHIRPNVNRDVKIRSRSKSKKSQIK